jgi:hypothetical protein
MSASTTVSAMTFLLKITDDEGATINLAKLDDLANERMIESGAMAR